MESLRQKLYLPGINGNTLKLIAAITMLIDHIGAALIENGILGGPYGFDLAAIEASARLSRWWQIDMVLRGIGRMAFPIYCFFLVEGFLHTRDVRKYWLRLLTFCFISEIPFDLAVFHQAFYWQYQNVFFTLLLGLTALWLVKHLEDEFMAAGQPGDSGRQLVWGVKTAAAIGICCGMAWLFKTDYDIIGVCLIVLFYMSRENPQLRLIMAVLVFFWEPMAVLAWIPMALYDGSRGSSRWKYWFYAFYPVHLLVLWGIRQWMFP